MDIIDVEHNGYISEIYANTLAIPYVSMGEGMIQDAEGILEQFVAEYLVYGEVISTIKRIVELEK